MNRVPWDTIRFLSLSLFFSFFFKQSKVSLAKWLDRCQRKETLSLCLSLVFFFSLKLEELIGLIFLKNEERFPASLPDNVSFSQRKRCSFAEESCSPQTPFEQTLYAAIIAVHYFPAPPAFECACKKFFRISYRDKFSDKLTRGVRTY